MSMDVGFAEVHWSALIPFPVLTGTPRRAGASGRSREAVEGSREDVEGSQEAGKGTQEPGEGGEGQGLGRRLRR